MAGRQRSMARKVASLEQKCDELFDEFYELMPKLYRERLRSNNALSKQPICAAWGGAWAGVSAASKGLEALRKLLDERAAALPAPPACPFVESDIGENHALGRSVGASS